MLFDGFLTAGASLHHLKIHKLRPVNGIDLT